MEVILKTKTLFLILFLFISLTASGKDGNLNNKLNISLNGGLTMKFSALGSNSGFLSSDTNFAYLIGFKAATVFNKSWYLGGAAYFLGNEVTYTCREEFGQYGSSYKDYRNPCNSDYSRHLSLGYGGITGGYTFNIKSFFRIETGMLIGGGQFSALNWWGEYYYSQSFFAMEPEVNLLFVITKFFAASINFSYRLISGMGQSSVYSTSDLSGPAVGLDIRLGSY